jgi:diguanylate cyclase (GGDEF)-like protein/PAS domain S-box-containing protein
VPDFTSILSGSYDPTALSIATAFAAVAILLLGTGVLIRGHGSVAARLFFLINFFCALWLACFAMMAAIAEATGALAWGRLGHFAASLVPASIFHFAVEYSGRRRKLRYAIVAAWLVCGAIAVVSLTTAAIMPGVRKYGWGYYPHGDPHGGILVASYGACLIASIYLFWRTYSRTEGKARERAGALLLAFALGSLGMFDYLPAAGIDLQPIGFFSCLAFATVAATAIWRYDLADLTPEYASAQILETMKGAVLVVDMDGRIRVVNRAACTMLGYSAERLQNEHLRTILEPSSQMTTGQLLNSMGVLEHTMVWRHADGSRIDVLSASSFVRKDDGTPVGVVYVASDFTERKRAEKALRESEHRYRTLFDANPLPMWVYDFETLKFTAVNDAAVRHYGYSRDEFLSMKITDIRPEEDVPAVLAALPSLEMKRGPAAHRHRRKDGSLIDVDITSFEFQSGGRRSRLVIAQDVTDRRRAEEELRRSEERYRELFENANDYVFTTDLQGRLTSINLAAERVLGYSRDELLGANMLDFVAPEHLDRVREALESKRSGATRSTFYEADVVARDGRQIPIEVATRVVYRDGQPVGLQGIGRDLTERKANEARYRLLFERNLAGVYRTTVGGRVLDCNEACARMFGFDSREDLLDAQAPELYFDPGERLRTMELLREQHSLTNQEVRMRRRDGGEVWVLENVTLLDARTAEGEEVLEGTIIDITDRKRAHEQIEYQAYHDSLTGLPNRFLFRDRISVALAHAKRNSRGAAVMFLDLDQFKLVNDTLGHTVGDRLLQAIGSRLVACVRAEDTVARMGGDEFTILLADLPDRRGAATVAQKVLEAIRHPVVVDDHELFVSTSIGISIFPDDGDDAEMLLKNADRAMYRAKELGRDNYQYTTALKHDGRLLLERSLHLALEREEFVVHYQPMVEIATGRVVGAEALVRWMHPEHGLVPPESFIPMAEESQVILPLGEWVLRTACRQMKEWHDAGHTWLRIAVNLSPRQFQQRELPATVERILRDTGFPPQLLDLEITESTAMQNAEQSLSVLNRLKEMGIRISIDDFGTGYSSLSYLKRLPIDTVKIDQDFVRDVATDPNDTAIISAVISMARALNLRVIAEGVETEEQLAFLRREQCAEMQGFLYSKPLSAEEFGRTLRTLRSAAPPRLRPIA